MHSFFTAVRSFEVISKQFRRYITLAGKHMLNFYLIVWWGLCGA